MSITEKIQCPQCRVDYRWRSQVAHKKVLCVCGLKFRMPIHPSHDVLIVTPLGDLSRAEYFGEAPPEPAKGLGHSATNPPTAQPALSPDLSGNSGTMSPRLDSGGSALDFQTIRQPESAPPRTDPALNAIAAAMAGLPPQERDKLVKHIEALARMNDDKRAATIALASPTK